MRITIALAGNPNCGKTTLFNDLTGSSQYVGNWPGVTVEKKEGRLKGKRTSSSRTCRASIPCRPTRSRRSWRAATWSRRGRTRSST